MIYKRSIALIMCCLSLNLMRLSAAPIHIPIPGFPEIPESLITIRDYDLPKIDRCRAINIQSGENNLIGVLHLPLTPQPAKGFPLVILFHGFRGCKTGGTKPIYKMISKELAKMGIASVRVDMAGCGDSEGSTLAIPISTYLQNGLDILQEVSSYPEIDNQRIGIAGFSLGCHTTCYLASMAYSYCKIQAISIWAAIADGGLLCKEAYDRVADSNFVNNVGKNFGFGPPPLILNQEDVSSFLSIQDHILLNSLPRPLHILCLHGTDDTIVSLSHKDLFARISPQNMQFLTYDNTGHSIGTSPHMDSIISDIVSHFQKHL